MEKKYDYLIVGAGLYGAVAAHELKKKGMECLVIDKRKVIAGNIYTENVDGINVHKYGAHIFHTSDKKVWDYVNQFAEFNNFVNSPVARFHNELYNLPFNMNTFSKLWGVVTPEEAAAKIQEQIDAENITGEPSNLEEQALRLVGRDVYEKLVKEYTEKQWGRDCKELPAFIIKRLPVRLTFDNNYFNDRYQGIPIRGYTSMIEKMLEGIDVRLNTDYFQLKNAYNSSPNVDYGCGLADKVIYTGMIDEFFDYRLGELEYRSLRFETEKLDKENYQGVAVVNYTSHEVDFTRIIEHKHFEFGKQPTTIITREYPKAWEKGDEPYYPVNNEFNNKLYAEYKQLADATENVFFGGRLGQYKYYDMDKVIAAALDDVSHM
jgi:UDP-galactopyranose mutase